MQTQIKRDLLGVYRKTKLKDGRIAIDRHFKEIGLSVRVYEKPKKQNENIKQN